MGNRAHIQDTEVDPGKELGLLGTSLGVQWLRLLLLLSRFSHVPLCVHTPNAGGRGSIPDWETKILHATHVLCSQKKKKKRMLRFGGGAGLRNDNSYGHTKHDTYNPANSGDEESEALR